MSRSPTFLNFVLFVGLTVFPAGSASGQILSALEEGAVSGTLSPVEAACASLGACVLVEQPEQNVIRSCDDGITKAACDKLRRDVEDLDPHDPPAFLFAARTTCTRWRAAAQNAEVLGRPVQSPAPVSVSEFCADRPLDSPGMAEALSDTIMRMIAQPYTCFHNCTSFSNDFHRTCEYLGMTCQTVSVECPDVVGHSLNFVKSGSGWLFVEPEGRVVGSVSWPLTPSDMRLVCQNQRQGLDAKGNCPCTIGTSNSPVPSNTNPVLACAGKISQKLDSVASVLPVLGPLQTSLCLQCCHNELNGYYIEHDIRGLNEWWKQCSTSCFTHFSPGSETFEGYTKGDDLATSIGTQCAYPLRGFSIVDVLPGLRDFVVERTNSLCQKCCEQAEREQRVPPSATQWCAEVCKTSVHP